eukprot:gene3762-7465_t
MAELDKAPIPPLSYQISRQMDQEKIDFLTKRIEELLGINNGLRTNAERNEKDTHDIVLYYQREMEMKDDIIARLNEELIKRENQMKSEAEKNKRKYDNELVELKKEYQSEIENLKNRCSSLDNELALLDAYKRDKDNHDRRLSELEQATKDHNKQLFDALESQERKFLNSKAQMLKDLEDQRESFREEASKEARLMMDSESRQLMMDNKRMLEELKFHNAVTEELQEEKASLSLARREVAILTQKEDEYSRQGAIRSREIKALKESVEVLERNQILSVEKFRHKTKELQSTVQKELEEATLDATGLRKLIKIKNRELRNMKNLATTILEQRGEVKDMIRKESKKTPAETMKQLNKMKARSTRAGSTFPSIKPNAIDILEPKTKSTLYQRNVDKVFIKDLTWDDKETVLRLLFAKMNGLQKSVDNAISHSRNTNDNNNVFVTEGGGRGRDMMSSQGHGSSDEEGDEDYLSALERAFPDVEGDDEIEIEEHDDAPGIMSLVGLA